MGLELLGSDSGACLLGGCRVHEPQGWGIWQDWDYQAQVLGLACKVGFGFMSPRVGGSHDA